MRGCGEEASRCKGTGCRHRGNGLGHGALPALYTHRVGTLLGSLVREQVANYPDVFMTIMFGCFTRIELGASK